MDVRPLVFVRVTTVYSVPPVCSAYWTAEDWTRVAKRVVEPLVIDAIGHTWIATGERSADGHLLYVCSPR